MRTRFIVSPSKVFSLKGFAQKLGGYAVDVRKAFGLPATDLNLVFDQWLRRSPEFILKLDGSAERFRTSGGTAESYESRFGQSSS